MYTEDSVAKNILIVLRKSRHFPEQKYREDSIILGLTRTIKIRIVNAEM